MNTPFRGHCALTLGALSALVTPAYAQSSLQTAASVLGLTPTAMTAAGLSGSDVSTFFGCIRDSLELSAFIDSRQLLASKQDSLSSVIQEVDPLDLQGAAAIQEAEAEVSAARQAFSSALDSVFDKAAENLSVTQRNRLEAWRCAASGLPSEFRIVNWPAAELRAVQAALLAERLAIVADLQPQSATVTLMSEIRSRADVADAITRLSTDLADISIAFEQATN